MSKQIVIIGGGVVGLSTAFYAAARGHVVTVVERETADHPGASFGNMGMIVPSHFVPLAAPGLVALGLKWMWKPASPFYIKPRLDFELWDWAINFWRAANAEHVRRAGPLLRDLHLASRRCFEEFAAIKDDFGLTKNGLLMLCKTERGLEEESRAAEQARQLGIPAETLEPPEAAKLDPTVRMRVAGAVYYPMDCHLSPARFMAFLKSQLDQRGVRFQFGTTMEDWSVKGARIEAVRTNQGELRADEFVLCAGSWAPLLARRLGLRLPMQAGKGYSLTLSRPRQLPQICAIFTEARVAVTPMSGYLRFGGTMEIAGLNEAITPRRVEGIIRAVPTYYPDFTPQDFAGVQPWAGLRPCSPDGLPYLGRTARYSNLTVATGHAMMGLSLGPITGKLSAEIISGEKPSIPIDLLHPERYCHPEKSLLGFCR